MALPEIFTKTIYFRVFALLFFLLVVYNSQYVNHNKDFDVFIQASKNISENKTPYDVWFHSGESGLKYFYSPLFAVLLLPIKNSPQWFYNLLWFLISLFCICRSFQLLKYFLPLNKLSEKQRQWFFVLSAISVLRFVLDNLDLGQMTFFLVWGSMESLRLMNERKCWTGGALLAIIINIKLIPLALLAYVCFRGEWKMAGLTILFLLLCMILPALIIGFDFNLQLHKEWLGFLGNTNSKSIFEDDGRPGLSAWVPSLLMETPQQYGINRNILNLSPGTVMLILNFLRLALVSLLIVLMGKGFRQIRNRRKLFYDLSLIALVTPVFFPHQGKYAMFYLALPYAFCIYTLIRLRKLRERKIPGKIYFRALLLLILSFALVTLTTDGLIGKHLRDVTEYLNIITYGVFCLLAAMCFLRPRNFISRPRAFF